MFGWPVLDQLTQVEKDGVVSDRSCLTGGICDGRDSATKPRSGTLASV